MGNFHNESCKKCGCLGKEHFVGDSVQAAGCGACNNCTGFR